MLVNAAKNFQTLFFIAAGRWLMCNTNLDTVILENRETPQLYSVAISFMVV